MTDASCSSCSRRSTIRTRRRAAGVRCAPANFRSPALSASDASAEATLRYLRTLDVELEPRKLWPSGLADRKGKITGCAVGRALAFADDAAWSDAIAALGENDGPVSAEIADAMVGVLSRWRRSWERPVVVVPMPSRRRPRTDPLARRAHRRRRQTPARRRLGRQWPAATERRRLGRPGVGAARFAAGHRRRPLAGRSRPARRRHLSLRVDRHRRGGPAHRRRGCVRSSRW